MELWTLGELAERVEAALADYPGQVNGRVRAVPDGRVIRWYTTIGLVDRPAEMRGRTALYSRRHLLQLVAIKRRQAQGHTLAQIQAELAGATDESLQPIAALTADPPQPTVGTPQPTRSRFWADRPTPTPEPVAAELVTAIRLADGVTVVLDQAATTTPDTARLAAAAAPLLAELARQRLLTRPSGDAT
ncbi:MerR-like DNA binding protein [Kribbella orskensis]|uniref:MerR-like DNA binding protein n=1 Tax=Kribbella orskensis TaxID=2512216 RepID=A0ABY2BLY5_9ACTN|nr:MULTISPECIES: MerR family transcriptional regulator [Kribbella]TCN41144.1 MerR-like DNA binding protein [Kribbella sp. VKM Ac-2500]TCO24396.1 MerR-like DNA binding protein [Kribbella orskensis]